MGRGERRCIRTRRQWFSRVTKRVYKGRIHKCVAKLKNREAAGAALPQAAVGTPIANNIWVDENLDPSEREDSGSTGLQRAFTREEINECVAKLKDREAAGADDIIAIKL